MKIIAFLILTVLWAGSAQAVVLGSCSSSDFACHDDYVNGDGTFSTEWSWPDHSNGMMTQP